MKKINYRFIKAVIHGFKCATRFYKDYNYRKQVKNNKLAKERYGSGYLSSIRNIKMTLNKRDGNKCHWCMQRMKGEEMSIDHIVEISKGGTNDLSNLRLLHKECHVTRHKSGV